MSKHDDKKQVTGKEYWRSLDQLAQTERYKEFLHREFPEGASENNNAWSRRNFLGIMGASLALAGLTGCRRPEEKIVPYVKPPEEVIPGIPQQYATAMPFGLDAFGLVVESHVGRPTKIEGNPHHPSTLGGSNVFMQAELLTMYDPDRSKLVLNSGRESSWDNFVAWWRERAELHQADSGRGLAVLSGPFASPTLYRLKNQFLRANPDAQWVSWEPISEEPMIEGMRLLTGEPLMPIYSLDKTEVIAAFDCDFVYTEPGSIVNSRRFMDGRRIKQQHDPMNRLYVAEAAFTPTGAVADHRLALQAGRIPALLMGLAEALANLGEEIEIFGNQRPPQLTAHERAWCLELAKDMLIRNGRAVVMVGRKQPAHAHAIAMAINATLGQIGQSVSLKRIEEASLPDTEALASLINDMKGGRVKTLLMIGLNPAYSVPGSLDFAGGLERVEHTVHMGLHADETAARSTWHLPQAHFLESWGDVRAADGTVTFMQPLIAPLYGGHSDVELYSLMATGRDLAGYDIVRETWQGRFQRGLFETKWQQVLHDGMVRDSATEDENADLRFNRLVQHLARHPIQAPEATTTDELVLTPSMATFDGRYANNGWLQECPDPVTKLAWDNAACLAPSMAQRLGVKNEDMVSVTMHGKTVDMPVWIVPGQADHTVVTALGYGRTAAGKVGNGVGFDIYPLRSHQEAYVRQGVKIARSSGTYLLANTQDHGSMEGRPLVREMQVQDYRKHPETIQHMEEHPPLKSLWKEHDYKSGYQWGMSIDLNACIGCNACTLACQAENNIPLVGKKQTRKGREMHWIRVDRYFTGEVGQPEMVHQPVPCQHCENAPCEQVCPVAATVHDSEGLNLMVYNRCIGTRYCSNNCPYKVRRFNFFNYTSDYAETIKMAQNPDVTVRSRGVMEKCTYCLQRINEARQIAKKDGNRQIRDGEIQTACQQACPTNAIVFGNINDPDSEVSRTRARNRTYFMLAYLNVQPRTSYMAKLRNPMESMLQVEKKYGKQGGKA
jgi:molybdopterin-containing oxidoreductase family iron-sulfur binding subunit